FPQGWNTWTSTFDPQNNTFAYWVASTGGSNLGVANNLPGWALCTQGTTAIAPTITIQPANTTANVGSPAQFTVAATGSGSAPMTYEWIKNGTPVAMTGVPTYVTPAVADADNNASFTVVVTGGNGLTTTSSAAVLTVTDNPTTPPGGTGGTGVGGNTNNTDTAI